jgi:hypothetical protein
MAFSPPPLQYKLVLQAWTGTRLYQLNKKQRMGLARKVIHALSSSGPSCMVNIRKWYGAPAASNGRQLYLEASPGCLIFINRNIDLANLIASTCQHANERTHIRSWMRFRIHAGLCVTTGSCRDWVFGGFASSLRRPVRCHVLWVTLPLPTSK